MPLRNGAKPTFVDLRDTLNPLMETVEECECARHFGTRYCTKCTFSNMQGEEGLSWLGSLCETRSLTSEMISVLADFLIARYPDDFRIEGLAAHPAISQATREELLDAPLGDNGRQSVAEGFAQNPTTSQDDLHKLACRAAVADYGNAALALHVAANPSTAPATLDALVANFNSSPRGAGKGDFADFHFERYNGDKVDPAIGYAGMRSYDWPKLLHAVALNPATSWETLTVLAYTCSEGGARDTARAKLRFMGVPGKSGQTKPARAPYCWNVTGAMNSLAEARVDITANALKELSGASNALRLMTGALLKGLKGSFGDVPTPQRPYVCETESLSGVIVTAQRLLDEGLTHMALTKAKWCPGSHGYCKDWCSGAYFDLKALPDAGFSSFASVLHHLDEPAIRVDDAVYLAKVVVGLADYQRSAVIEVAKSHFGSDDMYTSAKAAVRSITATS